MPKTITLGFALTGTVAAIFSPALVSTLTFTLPIAFDLNGLASITGLRQTGPPAFAFTFGLGGPLIAFLFVLAGLILSPITVVGLPAIFWLGLGALASVISFLPLVIVGIIRGLLARAIGQVLGGFHRALESTPGVPLGIFEAFGELVPLTIFVDDLISLGNLRTPTSPWAVLPLRFEI